jgi:hypothetical protein
MPMLIIDICEEENVGNMPTGLHLVDMDVPG